MVTGLAMGMLACSAAPCESSQCVGGGGGTVSTGGGGTTGGGGGGGGPTGGGGGGDATGGGAATDAGVPPGRGYVTLLQSEARTDAGVWYYGGVSAGFSSGRTLPGNGNWACTNTTMSACLVTRCQPDAGVAADAGPRWVSAGDLTLFNTSVDGGVVLSPTPTLTYGAGFPERLFQGGERLHFAASGATVSPFSSPGVVAPGYATLISPHCVDTGCGVVDRARPLTVSWTGSDGDTILVIISSGSTAEAVAIQCVAPAASGSTTIGTDVLSLLPAQSGSVGGGPYPSFNVQLGREATFDANGYEVRFSASRSVATGQVVVQ